MCRVESINLTILSCLRRARRADVQPLEEGIDSIFSDAPITGVRVAPVSAEESLGLAGEVVIANLMT